MTRFLKYHEKYPVLKLLFEVNGWRFKFSAHMLPQHAKSLVDERCCRWRYGISGSSHPPSLPYFSSSAMDKTTSR